MSEALRLIPELFIVAFFFNLLWEVLHSQLYTTCLHMEIRRYVPLIVRMSLKDAFFICVFYLFTVLLFGVVDITSDHRALLVFALMALSFSFIDERISVGMKRWQYDRLMPTMLGVGVTPLLEVAVTGVGALWYVFA